jgi:phage/plasmid-associated DNA primase
MNEAPNIDSVFGSMRRVIILGMNVQIPETEQDQRLSHKLSLERTAILNHIIQGYKEIYSAGGVIFEDDSTKAQTIQVIDDQDLVLNFVKYKNYFPIEADRDPGMREQKYDQLIRYQYRGHSFKFMAPRDIYKEFLEWCKDEGNNYPLGKLRFLSRLRTLKGERLGYEFKCSNGFEAIKNRYGNMELVVGVRSVDLSANPDPSTKKKSKKNKNDVPF